MEQGFTGPRLGRINGELDDLLLRLRAMVSEQRTTGDTADVATILTAINSLTLARLEVQAALTRLNRVKHG